MEMKENFTMKFIDLFCGAGLGARGAVRGGGTPLLAIDSWDIATDTYQANFHDARVVTGKIEDIDPNDYSDMTPDILIASPGFISQKFLVAGALLFSRPDPILKIFAWIDVFRPRWIVMEHLDTLTKWYKHKKILMELGSRGYAVSQLVIDSSSFGVPQRRCRLFIIANKDGMQITHSDLFKFTKKRSLKKAATILDETGVHKSRPLYRPGRSATIIDRAERAIDALGRGRSFIVQYGSNRSFGWQRIEIPLCTVTTVDRFGLVTWDGDVPMCRMLQPSELLCAMGADGHIFPIGDRKDKIRMIGSGTCAPVMEAIFRCIGDC